MKIALLGGTGSIGEGLALRFGRDTDHDLCIGSREREKAETKASEYADRLRDRGHDRSIESATNPDAAAWCDLAVLAVPPFYVTDTVEAVADELDGDTTLVSPAVGMDGDEDGLHYKPPKIGSVTELAASTAPEDVAVVGAFHNLPADRLADLDASLGIDTVVVGDDADARRRVADLADEVDGLRALEGGPLANASEIEAVTPLLINVARYNDELADVGVRFT